jgi:hypothetical protein
MRRSTGSQASGGSHRFSPAYSLRRDEMLHPGERFAVQRCDGAGHGMKQEPTHWQATPRVSAKASSQPG